MYMQKAICIYMYIPCIYMYADRHVYMLCIYMYIPCTSGTPIKFFHGIYLVYTRYIPFPWICQGYTWYIPRICFPDKILFPSI